MKNVLFVDDEETLLRIMVGRFEDYKDRFEVLTAGNGVQAMKALRESSCQLVICDWQMPEMDGLELCRTIRSEDLGRYVYTILLTAKNGAEHVVTGLSAGADDFVSKPYDLSELTERIRAGERVLAQETRDLVIFALAKLAESRDPETGEQVRPSLARKEATPRGGVDGVPGGISAGRLERLMERYLERARQKP